MAYHCWGNLLLPRKKIRRGAMWSAVGSAHWRSMRFFLPWETYGHLATRIKLLPNSSVLFPFSSFILNSRSSLPLYCTSSTSTAIRHIHYFSGPVFSSLPVLCPCSIQIAWVDLNDSPCYTQLFPLNWFLYYGSANKNMSVHNGWHEQLHIHTLLPSVPSAPATKLYVFSSSRSLCRCLHPPKEVGGCDLE